MEEQTLEFDAQQTEAVKACCDVNKRVVAVTGPAGTGKTSIMRTVYQRLTEAGYTVALCAPTGKAAKRIREATGIKAVTMHALLEYNHPGDRDEKTGEPMGESLPKRDKKNPLQHDVVLCDEYPMVNWELHRNLFDALKPGGRICCFGDINQLPPIEKIERLKKANSPFKTLLMNKSLTSIYLETIHRQGEGSGIVQNGKRIIGGRIPQRTDDFEMMVTDRPTDVLRDYVKKKYEEGIDYSSIDNQIITTQNKSWIGAAKLNALLQNIFRPEMDGWMDLPRHTWIKNEVAIRSKDKVIITANNYDIRPEHEKYDSETGEKLPVTEVDQVFNGETGIVLECTELGEVVIDLGDRTVTIPPDLQYDKPAPNGGTITIHFDPRKDIDLAYAITTHKAQGSEYYHAVYVLNKSTMYMQNRKNFYTGVTRARFHTTVISDQKSLSTSVWRQG